MLNVNNFHQFKPPRPAPNLGFGQKLLIGGQILGSTLYAFGLLRDLQIVVTANQETLFCAANAIVLEPYILQFRPRGRAIVIARSEQNGRAVLRVESVVFKGIPIGEDA